MYNLKPVVPTKNLPLRAYRKFMRIFRDKNRKKITNLILSTSPSSKVDDKINFSAHTLICERDIEMMICTAKALNLAAGKALYWIFHDDGTLSQQSTNLLTEQLPGVKVVNRNQADQYAGKSLKGCPQILAWRKRQVMALKLVDVALWGKGDRICYVDSDILFFRYPQKFLEELERKNGVNYFNKDITSAYVLPPEEISKISGIKPLERINAGLWVMNKADINFKMIEKWLNNPGFEDFLNEYVLDQGFISMLTTSSKMGVSYLPPTYDISFSKSVKTSVCKHYVGKIRHGYELEGLSYLINELNFINRWEEFAKSKN